MKQDITKCQFMDAFKNMGRGDQFSYDGLSNLYDWLEDFSDSTGEEHSLDVIALCCEFTEYEDIEDFQADYGDEYETLEDIENATSVIPNGDESFIVQQF